MEIEIINGVSPKEWNRGVPVFLLNESIREIIEENYPKVKEVYIHCQNLNYVELYIWVPENEIAYDKLIIKK